jgi:hypothetical protein
LILLPISSFYSVVTIFIVNLALDFVFYHGGSCKSLLSGLPIFILPLSSLFST